MERLEQRVFGGIADGGVSDDRGGAEGGRETRTATPWGTQEIGVGALHGEAQASGGNTGKAPFAAAYKVEARGFHGARPSQRGLKGGRQDNKGNETSGVWADDEGREASGVDHEFPGVGNEEGGRKASRVAENPRGPATEWAGESSYRRALTPLEWRSFPGGTEPPEGPKRARTDRGTTDRGGEGMNLPHLPSNQGAGSRRRQQRADGLVEDGRAAAPTTGHSGRRRQRRKPTEAYFRHRQRQAEARRALDLQVRMTGAGRDGGRPRQRGVNW